MEEKVVSIDARAQETVQAARDLGFRTDWLDGEGWVLLAGPFPNLGEMAAFVDDKVLGEDPPPMRAL